MATPLSPVHGPKITEGLHTHLMCPIHLDILKNPKTLACQHVVCEDCIEKWIAANNGELCCPECRVAQPLPAEGAKGLPSNFKIASLCEFVESMMNMQDSEVAACEEHLKKPVAQICLHCKSPVCEECVQVSHRSHKTVLIEEFLKVMGDPLPKLIGQAKNKLKEIFTAVDVLEKTRTDLRENYKLAKRETDDHVHKLMKMMTQAHVKMNGEIEKKYSEKEGALIAQLEMLTCARKEISELIGSQHHAGEDSSMTKSVMTASGQQLWNELTNVLQQDVPLAPGHNSQISVQWDKDLEIAIQRENLGKVLTKPVPNSHQTTLSLSASRADVQSEVKIKVALRDAVGSPVKSCDISSLVGTVSAPGSFTGVVEFTQGEAGFAESCFTPKYIGKYRIEVELFGNPVKNSPLNLIAKPRGAMKINERRNFNQPHDIIQQDDNFYITDKGNHQVVIMDKQFNPVGKFLPPSDPSLPKLDPYSIAYTGKTFVVTDLKQICVLEFTNSTFLQRFGQGILSQPTGIACDKEGKVYVADCQKNCIFVFNQLREHIAVLGGPGATRGQFDKPWFIAMNSKGEIVVADNGNHRIQVIDPTKDEVTRLIDIHHNQKTWDVRGLAVDRNDNIYVTVRQSGSMRGWSTETAIAYSPEGVFLGNFGEGFNYVRGMTVIEDEENMIVMIVDGGNYRIKGYQM
ncbi:RING finger protein nhl-1-like [Lytechinus pictus]|uniref:RING finger protein nhl-1-like n=1 Tax=Lytechinus pictus TaxID=7653 RepID=UPI0030B9EDE7